MKLKKDFTNAVDAIRVALKSAIDDPNFNQNDLSEVWRHYLGMKTISEKVTEKSPFNFSLDGVDRVMEFHDPDYNIQAAQPVDLNTYGVDTITFS